MQWTISVFLRNLCLYTPCALALTHFWFFDALFATVYMNVEMWKSPLGGCKDFLKIFFSLSFLAWWKHCFIFAFVNCLVHFALSFINCLFRVCLLYSKNIRVRLSSDCQSTKQKLQLVCAILCKKSCLFQIMVNNYKLVKNWNDRGPATNLETKTELCGSRSKLWHIELKL